MFRRYATNGRKRYKIEMLIIPNRTGALDTGQSPPHRKTDVVVHSRVQVDVTVTRREFE